MALIMGLGQCVFGLLVLITFDQVYCARPRSQGLWPRVLMQEPQRFDSQLRELWKPFQAPYGVVSQRPHLASITPNLAASSIQSKQELLGPVRELTWKFPKVPKEPAQPDFNFELQQPRPSDSIAVQCWENGVHVEVKQDLFGTGQLLKPSLLSLGGCSVIDVDAAAKVLIFHLALQECGSELLVTEDELVYIYTLDYRPAQLQSNPIVRSNNATIDDWAFERPSNVFFLNDVINIQASVKQYNHVPLRVFVDSCVATAGHDVNSAPMYSFIENHGCLTDAKYTGSVSSFLPRVQDDKFQFQLEAFRFQQESRGTIFITCLLKARAASPSQVDEDHKSCSFRANGWVSSEGSDLVCGCCDTSCGLRTGSVFPSVPGFQWEGRAQVGPLQVWENKPSKKCDLISCK